jgi:hypothetical protein
MPKVLDALTILKPETVKLAGASWPSEARLRKPGIIEGNLL